MSSDLAKAPGTGPAALPSSPPPAARHPAERLLHSPVLPTLLRLSLPNVLAVGAATFVSVAETLYIGILGTTPLAAIALAFPFVVLQQNFSSGAMGGGISSAISRALGARDLRRVQALALHALIIGGIGGIAFSAALLGFGPAIYRLLGGQGAVLAQAVAYSNVLFCGSIIIWFHNSMVSIVRGTGNMLVASALVLLVSTLQILLGGGLALGIWPLPRLGMPGVALAQVLATSVGAVVVFAYLVSGRARVHLRFRGIALERALFADIARPGALSCLQPLQTVLIAVIFTSLVARFGTEPLAGYSIGLRLEMMLIPIAFGVGAAAVPMVGIAIGSGDIARARRVAWIAGAVSLAVCGVVGLTVAVAPDLWAARFTSEAGVLAASRHYLRLAGPGYALLGLGLTLFFAQQGSGRVLRPILASTFRLLLVAVAGAGLAWSGFPVDALFALSGGAMVLYGLATAGALYVTHWSPAVTAAGAKSGRAA